MPTHKMLPAEEREWRHQRAIVSRDDLTTAADALAAAREAMVRAIGNLDDGDLMQQVLGSLTEAIDVERVVRRVKSTLAAVVAQGEG